MLNDRINSCRRWWWRMTGSNRRPPACKAGALPAELIPPGFLFLRVGCLVGLVGLEPTTPALSRRCSNQLSYRPITRLQYLNTAILCFFQQPISVDVQQSCDSFQKGGDPAAPSDTATLLRLHPSYRSHLRQLPPYGWVTDFGRYQLPWCDGRCVQDPGTYSP